MTVCVFLYVCVRVGHRQKDRQTDSSPVVVSQRWILGPSDTSSCLDIRPLRTHSARDRTKPHPHTHFTVLPMKLHRSVLLATHSPIYVWPATHGHMKDLIAAVRKTQEYLCTCIQELICMYMYMCVCVHVLVSLVWAKRVSSDITLSSLWNYSIHKMTVTGEKMQQISVKPQPQLWAGWVNCHKV